MNWTLKNLDGTTMAACPPGFDTLVLHLYEAGYVEPPDALVTVPCTSTGSLTRPVATEGKFYPEDGEGSYFSYEPAKDIWLDVTEETRAIFAARSSRYYVELGDKLTIDFDIYPEGQVGVAAWKLQSHLTMAYIPSCATAGVDTVEFWARPFFEDSTPLRLVGSWPCDEIDPYYFWDPTGNSLLVDPDEYQLGSGHTVGLANLDSGYFIELRAKRAGATVGATTDSGLSFNFTGGGNRAEKIYNPTIVMTDR